MILLREQINRYLRQIIMPEISGPGQKKLLEAKIHIYGDTIENSSSLIYYLASCGIGHICCTFDDNRGIEELFGNVRDLNQDLNIELAENCSAVYEKGGDLAFRIVTGNFKGAAFKLKTVTGLKDGLFVPTIISVNNGWKGLITTAASQEELNYLSHMFLTLDNKYGRESSFDSTGNILSSSLSGTLSAIEGIKTILSLGTRLQNILLFDLLKNEFDKYSFSNINNALEKFACPDNIDTFDSKKLSKYKVLIVGCGGLGSPAAYAFAKMGIGQIGLVDYDVVEISNLNRQILHSTSRIGMPKVKSAEVFIKRISPNVNIELFNTPFTRENALEIIGGYDLVIDGVDNFTTRYLINDACFFAGKPMIEAGVLRFDGLNMTIKPRESACYRCIFPAMPPRDSVPSCSEVGVLGPVPGTMGFIQASEAVKLLTGYGDVLLNRILFFDALNMDFTPAIINKEPSCPICGEMPSITSLQTYGLFCS
jgi:Dinucleotide-utilizing enzymes involved in molybdopterin and thiamine biosynthesis family 2